jgi:hypothetical protein
MPDDDDAGTRIAQLLELSELVDLITSAAGGGARRFVVLGGDLNCKPDTLEVDLLQLRLPQLADAWVAAAERCTGGGGGGGAASSGSGSGGREGGSDSKRGDDGGSGDALLPGAANPEGFTCHAPGSTFKSYKQVPERIDYIWTDLAVRRSEVALQMCPAGPPPEPPRPKDEGYDIDWEDEDDKQKKAAAQGGAWGLTSLLLWPLAALQRRRQRRREAAQLVPLSYSDHFAVRSVLAAPAQPAAAAAAPGAELQVPPAQQAGSGKGSPMKLGGQGGRGSGGAGKSSAAAAAAPPDEGSATCELPTAGLAGVLHHPRTAALRRGWARKVSAAYAAQYVLEEGLVCFGSDLWLVGGGGAALLISLLYAAVGAPLLWPGWAFSGAGLALLCLAVAGLALLGLCLLLMGLVGDRSQRRALQCAMHTLRVWMAAQGLADLPSYDEMLQVEQQAGGWLRSLRLRC